MISRFYELYAIVFARPIFINLNKFFFNISLRGMGVLNFRTEILRGEFDWLSSYLSTRDNPVVIDVGANVGVYSKDVFKINPNAIVFAFEPHPFNFSRLTKSFSTGNVNLYNLALGEKEGELELYDYAGKDGSTHASLYEGVITDLHKSEAVSYKVNVKSLDSVYTLDRRVDLLKIDTEGNELSVLLGATKTISRTDAIHIEFNEMNIISRTFFKDIWDLLHSDFYFYRLLPRGKLLAIDTYSSVSCELFHYQNIICKRKK